MGADASNSHLEGLTSAVKPLDHLLVLVIGEDRRIEGHGVGLGQVQTMSHHLGVAEQNVRVRLLLEGVEDAVSLTQRHIPVNNNNCVRSFQLLLQGVGDAFERHDHDHLGASVVDYLLEDFDPRAVGIDQVLVGLRVLDRPAQDLSEFAQLVRGVDRCDLLFLSLSLHPPPHFVEGVTLLFGELGMERNRDDWRQINDILLKKPNGRLHRLEYHLLRPTTCLPLERR